MEEDITKLSPEEIKKRLRETTTFEPVQVSFNSIPQGALRGSPNEPVFEILLEVPCTCHGIWNPAVPPELRFETTFRQAIKVQVGLWSGMWTMGKEGQIPIHRIILHKAEA